MSIFRFDVAFSNKSTNLPEDDIVNTWHFRNPAQPLPPSDFDNVRDMLSDFYNVQPPGAANRITGFYPGGILNSTVNVRAYNLDDPMPRPPVYESSFEATYGSGDPLPTEVALVLSIQADRQAGEAQARRRNRKYLGPFLESANETPGKPSTALINTICYAAKELLNASQASASWGWRVVSETAQADYEPTNGWVDNAWDTQRRRGVAATTRTPWSETLP